MMGPMGTKGATVSTSWQSRTPREVLAQLLPEEQVRSEVEDLEAHLPEMLSRFEDGRDAVRSNLDGMSRLLTASQETFEEMASRSAIASLIKKFMFRERKERSEIRGNLVKVQARAACVLEHLLERQSYQEQAVRYLGGRIELLVMENAKLKMVLVQLGRRIFSQLETLESRVDKLERQVRLSELFQSGHSQQLGVMYQEIAAEQPLAAALWMTQEFMEITEGCWRGVDVVRLQKLASEDAGLSEVQDFTAADLVEKALSLHDRARDGALGEWMKNGELYDRLMDKVPRGERHVLRERFPMHFLLNRPMWFVHEQEFNRDDLQVVQRQVSKYLDLEVPLSYWKIMELMLEERLGWQLETAYQTAVEEAEQAEALEAEQAAAQEAEQERNRKAAKQEEKRKRAAARKRAKRKLREEAEARRRRHGLVRIEPGVFVMGSPRDETGRYRDETPHEVRITRSFELGRAPVSQSQWTAVMGNNPSHFIGDDRPVDHVSWFDAVRFCNALSEREGLSLAYDIWGIGDDAKVQWHQKADGFRLPTEAEWEYSARAGRRTRFAGSDDLDSVAWWKRNSGGSTQSVCGKRPNDWGLYDMTGNVRDWCWDWKGDYPAGSVADPIGPGSGSGRVRRGGSYSDGKPRYLRIAFRNKNSPSTRRRAIGFRLAKNAPAD